MDKLTGDQLAEKSEDIRSRVEESRQIQYIRFKDFDIITNSEMSSRQTNNFCELDKKTLEFLRQAVRQVGLSARSYFRVLKLSRTIADLAGSEKIAFEHVAEALQYRPKVE